MQILAKPWEPPRAVKSLKVHFWLEDIQYKDIFNYTLTKGYLHIVDVWANQLVEMKI